jgi:DNA-binding transcriptional LysR family regulator
MGVNFEYYKVFYYVASLKNISSAAKALYLSQSTVSRAIQNLEHELGTKLFYRSKKGVTLTESGRVLYEHAAAGCTELFAAEDSISRMNRLGEGYLRIGTTELVMQNFLLNILKRFRMDHPYVRLDISFQDPSTAVYKMNAGELDVAILTSPLKNAEGMEVCRWIEFDDKVIAGCQYEELRCKVLNLEQLSRFPIITMRPGMSEREYLSGVFASHGVKWKPQYEVGSMPLLLEMVKADFGIGCTTEFEAYRYLAEGSVFEVRLEESLPSRDVCVITKSGQGENIVQSEFLNYLI